MPLPRFIVIKSDYNERYLGYVPPEEFKDIDQGVARSRNSFLRFDRDDVSTPHTKFEVVPAEIGNDLVHLKSCYNNKYWVRWSTRHWWIVAAADKPEEDRTKWSCTLFKPVYVDRNANTVRFIHLQLGHYACLWRIDLPFGNCLFGGSEAPDQDSCDVVTVIDWESPSISTLRSGSSGAPMADIDWESPSISTLRSGGSGAPMADEDNNMALLTRSIQIMPLPRFIVIKSNYNERYLGYVPPEEFKDIDQGVARSRNSFLRFDRDDISTPHTKFEVVPAEIGNDLVHLKSCYNNKYWVRWSRNHWWIVAAADKPEEDRTKWSCTLFKPVYIDRNANTVRFIHFELQHYACLWRFSRPFGDCLFGGSTDPDQDSCDVVTVIDWESPMISTLISSGSRATTADEDDDSYQDNNMALLPRNALKAIAFLEGGKFGVRGTITFSQEDPNFVTIIIKIRQIRVDFHALHINCYGDISRGSDSTGPAFCDLNNFEAYGEAHGAGKIERRITNEKISLIGEDSIIGRTVVVYAGPNPTPGPALAWGVIGYKFQ